MTETEYEVFCLRCLNRPHWQEEQPELASLYRERYVSGGWSEKDLATLVTLHMLYELGESQSDKELTACCSLIWKRLPVRDELRDEVIRKRVVEHRLRALENIECAHDGWYRPLYESSLAKARTEALAASFGVLPGTPEYDEWIRRQQSADVEGREATQ